MIFTETELKGAFLLEIKKLKDERGFFGRSWCANEMAEHGLKNQLCQGNTSFSIKKGTLRGMHFQQQTFQNVGLHQRSGKTVKKESGRIRIGDDFFLNDLNDDFI